MSRATRLFLLAILAAGAACAEAPPPFHATLTADRNPVYRHEVFTFTLTVYAASGAGDLGKELSVGDLPDATLLAMQEFRELAPQTVERNGVRYETRRFVCRAEPVVEGTIRLRPSLRGTRHTFTRSYFMSQHAQQSIAIPVTPLDLVIRPLPADGRPADFSGAVGQFDFDVSADPTNVTRGGLVTLTLRIWGRGNLRHLTPPASSPQDGVKSYEQRELADQSNDLRRAFRQVLLPDETRVDHIAPISFVYFDPLASAYRRVTRGPFPLSFHDAPPVVQPAPPPGVTTAPPLAARPRTAPRPPPGRWKREPASASERFRAASAALEAGRAAEAVAGYQGLWDEGLRAPELASNLGAAHAAAGSVADAVLWFRHAVLLWPRDGLARAGLEAACVQARVSPPEDGLSNRLTPGEWLRVGAAAAVLLIGALGMLVRRATQLRQIAAVAAGLALGAAMAGGIGRARSDRYPVAVAAWPSVPVRLAPAAESAQVTAIRAGQIVRITESADGWTRMASDHLAGWVPSEALKQIDRPTGPTPGQAVDPSNVP